MTGVQPGNRWAKDLPISALLAAENDRAAQGSVIRKDPLNTL